MDALKLFLSQRRFDLIYKYLYVTNPCEYNKRAYLENIRAFTNDRFVELEPSDGVPKVSSDDYVNSFDRLVINLKSQKFDVGKGMIPVQTNGEISDGAHRLAACAALGIDVETTPDKSNQDLFTYEFFHARKMDPDMMDYGALEYVKLNPDTYIVNLHAVNSTDQDDKVLEILNRYGFVYYKKNIKMNLNGYVNLVKLSYGSFWEREQWIGDETDNFAGAYHHAKMSCGKSPMRIFVFVCDDLKKVVKAKAEIRGLFNIGNYSVHICDTHEEAIWLAETYFNKNSLMYIKSKPYKFVDLRFDENLNYLRNKLRELGVPTDDVCCVGSSPINAYGIRHASDVDYLSVNNKFYVEDEIISPHDDQLQYYKKSKIEIVTNPHYFFYYQGIKIGTLQLIGLLKYRRGEFPKDWRDLCSIVIILLKQFLRKSSLSSQIPIGVKWYRLKKKLRKNKILYSMYKIIRRRKDE